MQTSNPFSIGSLCTFMLAIMLCFSSVRELESAEKRLNVVLILADDLRPDALGCTGNRTVLTPHLDALASRGVRFTRATCGYPICHVSRTEILTGRYLANADMPGTKLSLDPQWTLLPEVLHRAGWQTIYCGKWHTPGTPQASGYFETSALFSAGGAKGMPMDYPLSSTGRTVTGYAGWTFKNDQGQYTLGDTVGLTPETDARIADGAIDAIRRHRTESFFLHVNFTAPHDPLLWPSGNQGSFDAASLPALRNFVAQHPFDHGNLMGRDERIVPAPRAVEDVDRERAVYYALVQNVDTQVGRIVAALQEADLLSNTLLIFSSDHGLALGSHGLMGKQNQYEHTINVPLIIAGPAVAAGSSSAVQCYLRDLFPTLCEMTGRPTPDSVQGVSLAAACHGDPAEIHPAIIGRFTNTQRMMRTADGWKLIWYPQIERSQLFNVNQDPEEHHDLASMPVHRQRLDDTMRDLQVWLRQNGEQLP